MYVYIGSNSEQLVLGLCAQAHAIPISELFAPAALPKGAQGCPPLPEPPVTISWWSTIMLCLEKYLNTDPACESSWKQLPASMISWSGGEQPNRGWRASYMARWPPFFHPPQLWPLPPSSSLWYGPPNLSGLRGGWSKTDQKKYCRTIGSKTKIREACLYQYCSF